MICHEFCSLFLPQVRASHVCLHCAASFSQTDLSDPEMIEIKCWKWWHHLHIVKKTIHYLFARIVFSCVIRHHPLSIFDPPLCMSRINLSLWQPQQNPRVAMRIFVFLKISLGQTQSKKKILTTDTQLFKENTKSLSLSNCCHAFISLIYKRVLHGSSLNAQINTDSHF